MKRALVLLALMLGLTAPARAGEATIAVATNFATAAEALEADFEQRSGHQLVLVNGSTGKLYAQIVNGAPFDAFLSADADRPQRLAASGRAMADTRFTYAIGRLVLWSAADDGISEDTPAQLRAGAFRRLAIANPDLAPYGSAARDVLTALDVSLPATSLVMSENIGQAYLLVATGNAELGFVAAAQLAGSPETGSRWEVPPHLHAPIRQQAVLLQRADRNSAARAFLAYLQTPEAAEIIRRSGYSTES